MALGAMGALGALECPGVPWSAAQLGDTVASRNYLRREHVAAQHNLKSTSIKVSLISLLRTHPRELGTLSDAPSKPSKTRIIRAKSSQACHVY